MIIVTADDETLALKMITRAVREAAPYAEVYAFQTVPELFAFVHGRDCDIAFLDIEMRGYNGIEVAKRLKEIHPKINIIFATGYTRYMKNAFSLHASGYLLKPVSVQEVKEELENLRHSPPSYGQEDKIYIHTFGNFEVFYRGQPLRFARAKSKELFAYLVDRKGSCATMAEIAAVLWEDKEYSRSLLNQIHSFLSDIMKQLKSIGQQDVIIKQRNSISINVERVECDYYKFLKGDAATVNAFTNEYMTNYSWAEFTVGSLYNRRQYDIKQLYGKTEEEKREGQIL